MSQLTSPATAPAAGPAKAATLTFRILGWLTFLLLAAGVAAYAPAVRAYADDHAYLTTGTQPITITANPGDHLLIGVRIPETIKGLWAAPKGLTANLKNQQPLELVPAKTPDWGQEITTTNSGDYDHDTSVTGRYTVPDLPDGTVLTGKLAGTVTYPDATFYNKFTNAGTTVDAPIQITIRKPGAVGTADQLRYLAYALVVLAALFVAIGILATRRSRRWFRKAPLRNALPLAIVVGLLVPFLGVFGIMKTPPGLGATDVLGNAGITPFPFIADGLLGLGLGLIVFAFSLRHF